MKRNIFRFFSAAMSIFLLSLLCLPAFAAADPTPTDSRGNFYDWVINSGSLDDSRPGGSFGGGRWGGGGGRFTADEYKKYASELPATGITSSGGLIWNPVTTSGSASYYSNSVVGTKYYSFSSLPYEVMSGSSSLGTLALSGSAIVWSISNTLIKHGLSFSSFVIPISGSYRRLESTKFTVSGILESGNSFNYTDYYTLESFSHYEVGTSFSVSGGFYQYGSGEIPSEFFSFGRLVFYFPVYEIIPDTAIDTGPGSQYNINYRPTAITGGNYGIVGDDGTINTVTNNNQIVNETTNNYYNPATGTTVPITEWSYDYSDRSYNVTLEGGDTYTVTYGDENITIKEGDTNYTIYYIVNGSGSGDECVHEWYQTGAKQGDCITPAQRTYTCAVCGEQYVETDPVLGHVWLTKQTVPTQYDDEGNLIQEGYVIYECNRCGELYTSSGGVDPPSGGGSSSPGTSVCPHDWAEIFRTEPTCTLSGQIVFSCSKCGSTRSETLKAKGHTWQVERTVQTAYDEEGNLVQQGYTIYQCAVCAEQYKDTQGTGPPGGSSGDDEESIWDKIGNFIGSIFEGILGMIEAVVSKILDGLIALGEMLMEKLTAVVETVLTVFDEIPRLFGGFLDFLGIVFPYIPSEITLLLTFGIIAVTFIGIIKALRR